MIKTVLFSALLLLSITFMSSEAFAYSTISSDYYGMGDELKVYANLQEDLTIQIMGEDFSKSYYSDMRGEYNVGLPLTEELGYTMGKYDVILTTGDDYVVQTFYIDMIPPKFTLYAGATVLNLNDYGYFFGQAIGIEPKDYSFTGNVLIQILDSDGILVEDNWKPEDAHQREYHEATLSQFRVPIYSDDLYLEPLEYRDFDKPIIKNGYRAFIHIDPTVYIPGEIYTFKATHDTYSKSIKFKVLNFEVPLNPDYVDDVCEREHAAYNHMVNLHDEYLLQGKEKAASKLELKISNFVFSGDCETFEPKEN